MTTNNRPTIILYTPSEPARLYASIEIRQQLRKPENIDPRTKSPYANLVLRNDIGEIVGRVFASRYQPIRDILVLHQPETQTSETTATFYVNLIPESIRDRVILLTEDAKAALKLKETAQRLESQAPKFRLTSPIFARGEREFYETLIAYARNDKKK